MVPGGRDAKRLYLEDGVFANARPRSLFIDCSTIDVATTSELQSAAESAGHDMVDAPVSGGTLRAAEGTLAIANNYNDTNASNGVEPYSVVADPENIELNRAQFQYKTKALTVTGGRQRINIDDQRFVGSVGWRQNEQTFDALTGEATIGPVAFNATYSRSEEHT